MDRKTIIILGACFALLFAGSHLINKLYPPLPAPPKATNALSSAVSPTGTNATASAAPTLAPATTTNAPVPWKAPAVLTGPEQTLVLSNANAIYTFSSRGGGLSTIELVEYPEVVSRKLRKTHAQDFATLNAAEVAPVLTLFGDDSLQDDAPYALTPIANGVRAEKTLTNGLRIEKDMVIGTNYLVHATVRVVNTTDRPLALSRQELVIGTATPMGPDDTGQTEGVIWYNGQKTEEKAASWFENKGFLFWGGVPRGEFLAGQSNVVWVAAQNQFFVLAAMLPTPAQQLVSRPVVLPRPAEGLASATNNPPPKGFQTALVYPGQTLAAKQAVERQVNFYAGPKEYRTLARIAERFQNNVDLVMGYGGFFGFFSKALLLSMNFLHTALMLPYGWAIITITVVIKLAFWPITAAQTRTARRMAALQPQMKAIQEKYKDDPLKAQKKISEFWKEHKINPMSGCLPLLLQMPVFFGFFYMIRTAIELRGATFLWVADLSKPDTLFVIPGLNLFPFTLLGTTPEGLPFNLLPLFMGVTMLWQARLTPPSPGMDPAQAKMMKYLPVIFIVFLYNYSAGLALYWTVQNLLSVVQTKLTKVDDVAAAPATSPLTPASKKKK